MAQKILKQTGEASDKLVIVVSGTVNGINALGVFDLTTILKAQYRSGRIRQVHINGAYVGGPNGSFKAQAGGGKTLTLIINLRETGGGAFRRLTDNNGEFRIRTNDDRDLLTAPTYEISFSEDIQFQVELDKNPDNPFDIQWWAELDVDV